MKDENFLKANNARSLWHPMTSPSDSLKNAPTIVTGAQGVRITDIDGHEVVDGVGGCGTSTLATPASPSKRPSPHNWTACPIIRSFVALRTTASSNWPKSCGPSLNRMG